MIALLICYISFLTLVIVIGIHSYEEKLKKLNEELANEKKVSYYEANRVEELMDLENHWANMYDVVAKEYSNLLSEYRTLKGTDSEPKPE